VVRAVVVVFCLAIAGCTLGPPPGFSEGESWSFPLVGPLENGTLVVPVEIQDHGPYLFVIDPDSPVSSIDMALDSELQLYSKLGGEVADESDRLRRVKRAEVLHMKIGTLTVRNRTFWVLPVGTFNFAGRQIRGVIGRDILADSLVFGFDRDLGIGYLATQKGFSPPPGATRFGYSLLRRGDGMYRKLVDAQVNGKPAKLHVDLGEVASQIWEHRWGRYGLERHPVKRALIDELGTVRTVDAAAHAGVRISDIETSNVLFVPYGDRRRRDVELDGTIGLGFFTGYSVWNNFDDHTITMVPRRTDDVSRERMARWSWPVLDRCKDPGCTRAEVIEEPVEPGSTAPTSPPLLLIERDAATLDVALEVMLAPRGGVDRLPRLVVAFPKGAQRLTRPLDASYRGVTFEVVDISPYPRACRDDKPCVYTLSP
jgi:hypothetical protein